MNSYNELPLLQWKHRYCKAFGFDMFIVDNMSTDGSVEFMQANGIEFCQIDTNEVFDLRPLLVEMNVQLHRIKPDWFIYEGMDVFPTFATTLQNEIAHIESSGYTQISLPQLLIYAYKPFENPFRECNRYRIRYESLALISKYTEDVYISPDCINIPNKNVWRGNGAFFELHCYNTPERRAELLERRRRAWENGMPSNWGTHYQEEAYTGFVWPRERTQDIKDNEYYNWLFKKLRKI